MSNRLTIYQGNTFTIRATVTDENGAVVNLTGLTVKLTAYNRNTLVITKTNTSHTTPTSGITTFSISKTETLSFPIALLRYEVEVTYVDGAKFTGTRDFIEVIEDLT